MTAEQEKLKAKHGTPKDFEAAVIKSYNAGEISSTEAKVGILNYMVEWEQAGGRLKKKRRKS